jgi:hypothetical protein
MKKPEPGVIYSEAELRQLLGWRELLRRKLRRLLRVCGMSERPDRDPEAGQPPTGASGAYPIDGSADEKLAYLRSQMSGQELRVTAGVDVRSDSYVLALAFDKADELEKQARALHAQAAAIRAQSKITVQITPAHGMPGQFTVFTRLGGKYFSSQLARSAEEACQVAFHVIQGFEPPLRLPPFGTPVDRTLPEIGRALAESGRTV